MANGNELSHPSNPKQGMTNRIPVLVVITIILLVILINNVHRLPAQFSSWNLDWSYSQEKVEVIESFLNDTAKANASSSSKVHVVYCIFKPRNVAALDYATFKAIAPTNMKIVAQNGGKFHILTNDGHAIRTVLANSTIDDDAMAAVTIQDFRKNASSIRFWRFRQHYISQTLNDASYEELCMLRWIIMADYFKELLDQREKNVDRILAIDTDVLLTADPRRLLHIVQPNKSAATLEGIMIINGAAMALTTRGLENFVTFLSNVYATRENATAFVKQHGEVFPLCRPESSVLIPCVEDDNQMWHVSDMHIWNAWFQENESSRSTRLFWSEQDEEPCLAIQPVWSSTKLVASLEGFHFQKQGSRIKTRVNDASNATDVCLVHFQGETKQFVPGFVSFVTGESNQSSFSTR